MWESLDHRKFPRLNINCDIEIRKAKTPLHFSTITENIGAGGVCVILSRELDRHAGVLLKLHLPDGLPVVECSGKICWAIRNRTFSRAESEYDTGIEFLEIREEDRERIRRIVKHGEKGKAK